ncbi:hypothetical protein K8I28_05520, partial [bacterium]|nr:hypothetical protein [bacterium]
HISIYGYNNNSMELFTHSVIKDYVLWFTKHGSIEREFNVFDNSDVNLLLKGLDSSESESITHGHIFPPESNNINELFSEYIVKAPDYYCKRVINRGQLKNRPDIHYDAIFSIEGNRVKHGYNDMVRRGGYQAPVGAYTVQERYGLWICKDYIPIQRVNEWIPGKGYEYTKLHAFINCQNLSLTANRGSIDNTPSEILKDLKNAVKNIYEKIIGSDEWSEMEWLEQEASGYRTAEKEKSDYDWRIKKIKRRNTTIYKGVGLIEPERESGVLSIFIQLSLLEKELFPFEIVDYDTHVGIDVIAKGDIDTPIYQSKLYYVEFKNILTGAFNHSFDNLHAIVCWTTSIKNGDVVHDVKGKKRVMKIVKNENCERKFFLDERTDPHRIQVYVLKDYLKEKLNIEFTPNNSE